MERDWSPNQGALRNNQWVSRGQSWGGLSGGLWDNLWPYGFGLELEEPIISDAVTFGHAFADSP